MSQAPAPLPDKFAALADGPTDTGTPTEQHRAYMLTRPQTERLVKAARAVSAPHDTELPAGYTLVLSTDLVELRRALAAFNIDA